jgi:hypothetical protein
MHHARMATRIPIRHAHLGIDLATLRALAVAAEVDPRSVIAELQAARGERPHVRGMAGNRVRRLLAEKGLIPAAKAA